MVALRIQLGAPVKAGDFPNDQKTHLSLGLRAEVDMVGKVVLALKSTIKVFPIVAVAQKRGAGCEQRDDVVGIVLVVVKHGWGGHSEEGGERNEKKKNEILDAFNFTGGVVRLAIEECLIKICFRTSK